MQKLHIILFLSACFFSINIWSQQVTVSGTVVDAKTGETLIGANVYNLEVRQGTVANNYGFYSLKLPLGDNKIKFSYAGYQVLEGNYFLTKDTVINIRLLPDTELDEVVITASNPQQNVTSTEMGTIRLSPNTVAKVPTLLGETDIIKTLQLMPGVQSGTEGSSGFYVRGGGPDQNLILLDGVPVYNVNHLFGFMSVFNSDAIRNVTLIKGGFPARYGGRLSSVLDIRMKEGNNQEFKGEASIGIISSKLTLEGPIVKDRTSFMVSGRRSYFDVIAYPFQKKLNNDNKNNGIETESWVNYFLQDFNVKVNHIINDRQKIYLSFYTGKDKFSLEDDNSFDYMTNENDFGLEWGNFTSALRWNYIMSNEMFCNVTATLSDYKFKFFYDYKFSDTYSKTSSESYIQYYSQVRDYALKVDFDYIPAFQHSVKFGASATRHSFSPGVTVIREESQYDKPVDETYGNVNLPAYEYVVYAEDDFSVNERLKINAGLHFSAFGVNNNIYASLEPRVSGRYLVAPNLSVKASYVKMQQYLHLLANSSFGLPTDLWVPTTARVKPQRAWQTAVGATYSLNNDYEFTIEGYYKKINDLIDYGEGASFFDLRKGNWEDLVVTGMGECYGLEFLVQKPSGKLTGWVGYTLSWSDRYFDEVNYGGKFPYRYDARHDVSITASYQITKNIDLGAVWIYRTGYPFTLSDEQYLSLTDMFISGGQQHGSAMPEVIEHFEQRNNYRMPDYHRLDVGANFHRTKKKSQRTWGIGMYNAYGRNNPFFVFPSREVDDNMKESVRLKQVSVFNFIPYVRWGIKF